MALATASGYGLRTTDDFTHEVVQRSQDLTTLGVVRRLLLAHFLLVTAGAVLGSDDGGNGGLVVLIGIRFGRIGLVTVVAIDILAKVSALLPFGDQRRILIGMALDALITNSPVSC